ncbi:MAG: SDR family oxidoreductase [Gemmataceae bacterium]|nr:SDR family oxidoreductase [Gemmataceae bacterium]
MSPLAAPPVTRLIVGCGFLGRVAAARWLAQGHRVSALTRANADTLRATGVEPVTGDVLARDTHRALPTADTVLYAVGMDYRAGHSMRDVYVQGLANVLDALPTCGRFIYISSTSVYGQSDGDFVTETSPTEPAEESGRVVLEAEALLRARRQDAIILRSAGLYGPNRLLRKQPILRGEPLVGDAGKWLNLVHVADAAAAILHTEAHAPPGETYNVSDGTPVSRRDFYTLLAELLHAPAATFDHRQEPGAPNRRIDATKLRALGWAPTFPSYREGLTAAVAETTI